MFCPKCGKEVKEVERFCSSCGAVIDHKKGVEVGKKPCPRCGMELVGKERFCSFCGTELRGFSIKKEVEPKTENMVDINGQSNNSQFSFKQPIWKLVFLYVFTFGLYEIYWFYRNWKHMKIHKNLDIRPGFKILSLLIPIYGWIIIDKQFKDIKDFARSVGCDTYSSPGELTAGLVFLHSLYSLISRLPNPYANLSLIVNILPVFILITVQKTLNNYWMKEQTALPERKGFSGIEIAIIILGGIFLILTIIGTLIPE